MASDKTNVMRVLEQHKIPISRTNTRTARTL